MTDTLSRSGSYTLFAPTNAAFEKLPQNVRDQLGQEQHRDQLRAILAQHVVEGHSFASTQFPEDIKAMGGDPIDVSLTNGRPRLNIGEPQPQTQPARPSRPAAEQPSAHAVRRQPGPDRRAQRPGERRIRRLPATVRTIRRPATSSPAPVRPSIAARLQTTERQPLQQASGAIDRATQALQNNDRAAARTAVNEALPPLRQAEAATPSSANQTNQQVADRRSTDRTPARSPSATSAPATGTSTASTPC